MDESAQQPQTVSPMEPPPSNPPGPTVPAVTPVPNAPLTYEETPIIEPVNTSQAPPSPAPPQVSPQPEKKRSGSCLKTIGIILLVALLFAGGIWLSSFVRQFLPSTPSAGTPVQTNVTPTPGIAIDPYETWKSYDVKSGITKLAISGLQFKLPPDVLSPICDGACVSQGTYLPGGTRLTVAPRGAGQSLRDYRGTLITDANGVPIPTKPLSIGGLSATEYESSASGRTVSGYAFTQIRGVMIPLTDMLSVEVNHFTPSGIAADFAADDALFDSIIKTFTYAVVTPGATIPSTPSVTIAPSVFPTATQSGY